MCCRLCCSVLLQWCFLTASFQHMHRFYTSFHRLVRSSGHSGKPTEGHPYLRRYFGLGRDMSWGKVRRTMVQGSQKSGPGCKCIDCILCVHLCCILLPSFRDVGVPGPKFAEPSCQLRRSLVLGSETPRAKFAELGPCFAELVADLLHEVRSPAALYETQLSE